MDLKQYDGKPVRITDSDGGVFEAIADYFSPDYSEHEFGREQEGLQLVNWLFYEDYIESIEVLEDRGGPWGPFSEPFGAIEEENLFDEPCQADENLYSEEDAHVLRMLRCIEKYLDPAAGREIKNREEIMHLIRDVIKLSDDERTLAKARELIEKWG